MTNFEKRLYDFRNHRSNERSCTGARIFFYVAGTVKILAQDGFWNDMVEYYAQLCRLKPMNIRMNRIYLTDGKGLLISHFVK